MYNKDNIEGIIFKGKNHNDQIYKVGLVTDNTCVLTKVNSNWKHNTYEITSLIRYLNDGEYIVLEHSNKIHECW